MIEEELKEIKEILKRIEGTFATLMTNREFTTKKFITEDADFELDLGKPKRNESKANNKAENYWSKSQVDLLKKLYGNSAMSNIVEVLNKPKTAIYAKAFRLGLKRREAYRMAEPDKNPKSEFDGIHCPGCDGELLYSVCKNKDCNQYGIVQVLRKEAKSNEEMRKHNRELFDR